MISSRSIAHGNGWSIEDVICRSGPADRRFEERHSRVSIAAVISGSFRYRCDAGSELLHPGALLLGNPGSCFECGHEHSRGDRCIAFHMDVTMFEEMSSSVTGTAKFRFPRAMMPAMPELLPTLVEIEALAGATRDLAAQSLVVRLAERVGETFVGKQARRSSLGAGEEKRISAALHHLESRASEDVDLDLLAGIACMSKYHFLRVFRRITGVTPYKYLLGLRMRQAALALRGTNKPVSAVAFDAGFGDLSTFNHRFKQTFGATPTAFRQA
ncbi:MAG: AraC family transcriptional regulator [Micropepsaceae bacterium]